MLMPKNARTMPENESNLLNDDIHLFGADFEGVRRIIKVASRIFNLMFCLDGSFKKRYLR